MALIHWKQIDGDLTNARVLTGSLRVDGDISLSGSFNQTSGSFELNFDGVNDYFRINVGGEEKLKVTEQGVLQLSQFSDTPAPISGGLFYSASDDFFLGFTE